MFRRCQPGEAALDPFTQGSSGGLWHIRESNSNSARRVLPHYVARKPDRGFPSRQIELKINFAAQRQPALRLYGQAIFT